MTLSNFSKKEIEFLLSRCNFVNHEVDIFKGRVSGKTLEEIAEEINISYDYARKLSQKVNAKILKEL